MNWSPSLSTGPRVTPAITNRSTSTAGSPWAVSPAVRTPSHGATAYKSHTRAPWGFQTTRRHPAAFHHLPRDEGREKEGGKEEGRGAEKTEHAAGHTRRRRRHRHDRLHLRTRSPCMATPPSTPYITNLPSRTHGELPASLCLSLITALALVAVAFSQLGRAQG